MTVGRIASSTPNTQYHSQPHRLKFSASLDFLSNAKKVAGFENMSPQSRLNEVSRILTPLRLQINPTNWHPLPLTQDTKIDLMRSLADPLNFEYSRERGLTVTVPVGPDHGSVPRASPSVLRAHVEGNIRLTRCGQLSTRQPTPPLPECYSWWLGQLIHHGLPLELSVDEAKAAIRAAMVSGTLSVPESLSEMEKELRNNDQRDMKNQVRRERRAAARRDVEKQSRVEVLDASEDEGDHNALSSIVRLRSHSMGRGTGTTRTYFKYGNDSQDEYSSEFDIMTKLSPSNQGKKGPTSSHLQGNGYREESKEYGNTENDGSGCDTDSLSSAGTFDGDVEYEQVVSAYAEQFEERKYGLTDSPSEYSETTDSSSDDDIEFLKSVPVKSVQAAAKSMLTPAKMSTASFKPTSASNRESSTPSRSLTKSGNPPTAFTRVNLAVTESMSPGATHVSKQLEIKRDRGLRQDEFDRMSKHDLTPTPSSNNRTSKTVVPVTPSNLPAYVHSAMTYDDVADANMRGKIVKMRAIFPKQSIHLCYVCLVEKAGNFELACNELVERTMKTDSAQRRQQATTNSHSKKRKVSNSSEEEEPNSKKHKKEKQDGKSSTSRREQDLAGSDSDDNVVIKQEPLSERVKFSRSKFGKNANLISDQFHGSRIDLVNEETSDSFSDEDDSKFKSNQHYGRGGRKKETFARVPAESANALSVEIPSAGKARPTQMLPQQVAFSSSPSVGPTSKGILKTTPGFQPRRSLLDQALAPSASSRRSSESYLYDLSLESQDQEPELPPQPLARRSQQGRVDARSQRGVDHIIGHAGSGGGSVAMRHRSLGWTRAAGATTKKVV